VLLSLLLLSPLLLTPHRQQKRQVVVGTFGDSRRLQELRQLPGCLLRIGRGGKSEERVEERRMRFAIREVKRKALQAIGEDSQMGYRLRAQCKLGCFQESVRNQEGGLVRIFRLGRPSYGAQSPRFASNDHRAIAHLRHSQPVRARGCDDQWLRL